MIVTSVAVAALMVAGVLFLTFGCKNERKRFMDNARDNEQARHRLAVEIVDHNRVAHIEAFEAEHGPVDPELVARFEKALDP
jgi:hypothetical protein